MISKNVEKLIELAMSEDIGDGDHTTLACIAEDQVGQAELLVKENGVISGIEIAKTVFERFDSGIGFHGSAVDGEDVEKGQTAFTVVGPVRSILTAERLVLNLMQRMSGISTITKTYANCIAHTKAKVLDTRKTTPGMRWFEKEAVRLGGGVNHRHGLYDMMLIKDNHVDAAGSISDALNRAHDYLTFHNLDLQIEIEVRSLDELEQAIQHGGLDRVLLDNFSPALTKQAVDHTAGRFLLESSGGITLETIANYAEQGVDYVSVGALTHSVKSLDLSLKIVSD